MAVRHRAVRVLDGLPPLAEGRPGRPALRPLLGLAALVDGHPDQADAEAVQIADVARLQAVPQVLGAGAGEAAAESGGSAEIPRRPVAGEERRERHDW